MDPITAGIIAGGGLITSAAGAAASGNLNQRNMDFQREMFWKGEERGEVKMRRQHEFAATQAGLQRDWSAKEAAKTRDFQKEMRDTAVTSQISQMENAGINKALIAGGPSGGASAPSASTPSGAAASPGSVPSSGSVNLSTHDLGKHISAAVNSAVDAFRASNEYGMMKSNKSLTDEKSQTENVIQEKVLKEIELIEKQIGKLDVDTRSAHSALGVQVKMDKQTESQVPVIHFLKTYGSAITKMIGAGVAGFAGGSIIKSFFSGKFGRGMFRDYKKLNPTQQMEIDKVFLKAGLPKK